MVGLNPGDSNAWRFVSNPLLSPDLIVVPSCKDGPTVAFNPVGAKGNIDADNKAELWRVPSGANFRTPDVIAPIRVGDIVYFAADGTFTAAEAKTGKLVYRQQITNAVRRSNLVAADGKIYTTATTGTTEVVQAGKEFKKLATNNLPDTIYAGPAIADGRIYLRGYGYLWAIGSK